MKCRSDFLTLEYRGVWGSEDWNSLENVLGFSFVFCFVFPN